MVHRFGESNRVRAVLVRAGTVGRVPRRTASFAAPLAVLAGSSWVPVARYVGTVRERVERPSFTTAFEMPIKPSILSARQY